MNFRLHVSHRSAPELLSHGQTIKGDPTCLCKGKLITFPTCPRKIVLFWFVYCVLLPIIWKISLVIPYNYKLISGVIVLCQSDQCMRNKSGLWMLEKFLLNTHWVKFQAQTLLNLHMLYEKVIFTPPNLASVSSVHKSLQPMQNFI